jgi:hypothetical protein
MQEKNRYTTDAEVRQECNSRSGAAKMSPHRMPQMEPRIARVKHELEKCDTRMRPYPAKQSGETLYPKTGFLKDGYELGIGPNRHGSSGAAAKIRG